MKYIVNEPMLTRALLSAAALAFAALAPQEAAAAPWCYRSLLAGASGPCVAHTGYKDTNFPNTPFKGWVLLVASGGWVSNPKAALTLHNGGADYLRYLGYNTYTIEHTPAYGGGLGEPVGDTSLADVKQHYDDLRAMVGSSTPICIWGQSSGGHLAQLAARDRPSINCVILQEAPTDLETLPLQSRALAARAFGLFNLYYYSPIHYPPNPGRRLIIGATLNDYWVGMAQSTSMRDNRPTYVRLYQHTSGNIPWAHGHVTQESIDLWWYNVGQFAPEGNL